MAGKWAGPQIDTITKEGVECLRTRDSLIFTLVRYHVSGELRICRQELLFEYNHKSAIEVSVWAGDDKPLKSIPRPGARIELAGKLYTVLDTFIA
jgi:hypothetical protein